MGDFSDLVSLEILELGHNWLSAVPVGIFSGLSSLKSLYIDNDLSKIEKDRIRKALPDTIIRFM